MDLTKRQQEIFDFIKRYSAKYGYPPTVRDIGKAVGLASSSTVHAHLANLEKIGLLRRDPTKPRAMELLDRAAAGVTAGVQRPAPGLPLVGQVAAGQPILAEENIEEYIQTSAVRRAARTASSCCGCAATRWWTPASSRATCRGAPQEPRATGTSSSRSWGRRRR